MVNERPGAVSVNNILGHQHPEQTPSTTYLVLSTRGGPSSTPLGVDSVNNVLGPQHPGWPLVNTARSRLRQQRTWSPDPEQTPSITYLVPSTQGSPRYQRRLKQTPSSATQRAQSTALLGTIPIINVA